MAHTWMRRSFPQTAQQTSMWVPESYLVSSPGVPSIAFELHSLHISGSLLLGLAESWLLSSAGILLC